jgi:hypothetical protein
LAALIAAHHAAAAGSQVTYQVTSDGSLSTVTYFDGMDDEKQISDVDSPWTMTFTNQATYPTYGVCALKNVLHVSCLIALNGKVRDRESATGWYVVVNLQWKVAVQDFVVKTHQYEGISLEYVRLASHLGWGIRAGMRYS